MNILVTGGAGFIGSNVAEYYLSKGYEVTIIDNLVKKGSEINIAYLSGKYSNLVFLQLDITKDQTALKNILKNIDVVFHLAAQVAVTLSIIDPRSDFETNSVATFNILESLRLVNPKAQLIFSSTNKVYGNLPDSELAITDASYIYKNRPNGISELERLNFHTPYACSKGSADQYVRDYATIYKLNTVVFRQSCIYGQRQLGTEDQGWVAWFVLAALKGTPITIYGDGKQVRDLLHISDLLNAYDKAIKARNHISGEIFNIGGGINNKASVIEVISLIEDISGKKIDYVFSKWRPGDQKIFISDISKVSRALNWEPATSVNNGIKMLIDHYQNNV